MAGRTKHIHAQGSFRFLAERLQTLAKRLVGETSGHQTNPTLSTTFLPRATPLSRVSCSTPTSFPGFSPTRSYGAREREGYEREPANEVGSTPVTPIFGDAGAVSRIGNYFR